MAYRIFCGLLILMLSSHTLAAEKETSSLTLGGSVFVDDKDPASARAWTEKQKSLHTKIDFKRVSTKALQQALGSDPKTLFAYLKTNIRFEPYPGLLRGDLGTLVAQAGNSIDRSLLLAALLAHANVQHRFAVAELDAATSNKLIERSITQGKTIPLKPGAHEQLFNHALGHLQVIGDALVQNKFQFPEDYSFAWQRASAASVNHYWVQANIAGQWVDLDPSLDLEFGKALVKPASTLSNIPAELAHKVKLEFFIVHKNQPVKLLEKTISTQDLITQKLGFYFSLAANKLVFNLSIHNGGKPTLSSSLPLDLGFNVDAHKIRNAPSKKVVDLFGSLPDTSSTTNTPTSQTTDSNPKIEISESYLLLSILQDNKTLQRKHVLLKTNSTAKQTFEQQKTELLNALTQVGVIDIRSGQISAHLAALQNLSDDPPNGVQAVIHQLNFLAKSYALLRDLFPVSVGNQAIRFYDGPNVLIAKIQAQDPQKTLVSLDLLHKSYTLLWNPDPAKVVIHPFFDYVQNGVLDHSVERVLLGSNSLDHTIGKLTDLAIEHKQALVMRPFSAVAEMRDSVDVANLKDSVYLTFSAPPADWPKLTLGGWIIASKSGVTMDRNYAGYHSQSAEYSTQAAERSTWVERVKNLSCTLAVVVGSVTAQVGEAITVFDPADGSALLVLGSALEGLGSLGCRNAPRVSGAPPTLSPPRPPSGFTPGTGFRPRPDAIIQRFTNMRGSIRRFR